MDTDPYSITQTNRVETNATASDPFNQWTEKVARPLYTCIDNAIVLHGGDPNILKEWRDNARGQAPRIAAGVMSLRNCLADELLDPAIQVSFTSGALSTVPDGPSVAGRSGSIAIPIICRLDPEQSDYTGHVSTHSPSLNAWNRLMDFSEAHGFQGSAVDELQTAFAQQWAGISANLNLQGFSEQGIVGGSTYGWEDAEYSHDRRTSPWKGTVVFTLRSSALMADGRVFSLPNTRIIASTPGPLLATDPDRGRTDYCLTPGVVDFDGAPI